MVLLRKLEPQWLELSGLSQNGYGYSATDSLDSGFSSAALFLAQQLLFTADSLLGTRY